MLHNAVLLGPMLHCTADLELACAALRFPVPYCMVLLCPVFCPIACSAVVFLAVLSCAGCCAVLCYLILDCIALPHTVSGFTLHCLALPAHSSAPRCPVLCRCPAVLAAASVVLPRAASLR